MALKKLLMGRFRQREGSTEVVSAENASIDHLRKRMFELVSRTIMLRQIDFIAPTTSLALIAAEKMLCKAVFTHNDKVIFEHDFTDLRAVMIEDQKKLELIEAILAFVEVADTFSIDFHDVKDTIAEHAGVSAETLLRTPESFRPEPVLSAPQSPVPKVEAEEIAYAPLTSPEEPSVKAETDSSSFDFLNEIRTACKSTQVFNADGEFVGKQSADVNIDIDTFSGIEKWRAKMAPHLGETMLFVMTVDGANKDTFAIATNGKSGVAVELDRQKTGNICLAWRKARDKNA